MKQIALLFRSLMVVMMMGCMLMSHAQKYEIDRGRVFYGDQIIMHADAKSFVDLGSG